MVMDNALRQVYRYSIRRKMIDSIYFNIPIQAMILDNMNYDNNKEGHTSLQIQGTKNKKSESRKKRVLKPFISML